MAELYQLRQKLHRIQVELDLRIECTLVPRHSVEPVKFLLASSFLHNEPNKQVLSRYVHEDFLDQNLNSPHANRYTYYSNRCSQRRSFGNWLTSTASLAAPPSAEFRIAACPSEIRRLESANASSRRAVEKHHRYKVTRGAD